MIKTVAQAEHNRQELMAAVNCGVLPINNPATLRALRRPITMLMRTPPEVLQAANGLRLIKVHMYGRGPVMMAPRKEILP